MVRRNSAIKFTTGPEVGRQSFSDAASSVASLVFQTGLGAVSVRITMIFTQEGSDWIGFQGIEVVGEHDAPLIDDRPQPVGKPLLVRKVQGMFNCMTRTGWVREGWTFEPDDLP